VKRTAFMWNTKY